MPAVSRHRYTVHTSRGSGPYAALKRAFHNAAPIEVKDGDYLNVPRGTFLVVGMHEEEGTFKLARWRDEEREWMGEPLPDPE